MPLKPNFFIRKKVVILIKSSLDFKRSVLTFNTLSVCVPGSSNGIDRQRVVEKSSIGKEAVKERLNKITKRCLKKQKRTRF